MTRAAVSVETRVDSIALTGADGAWGAFHARWSRLAAPLRPPRTVADAVRTLITPHDARVLLLGVTPELAGLARRTVAIDSSDSMIAHVWPGNGPERCAVRGDWLALPCATRSMSAAMGDGSLNCLAYPEGYHGAFRELARVVRPGGRVVIRVYLTPHPCESLSSLHQATMAGRVSSIHALKWRLANALCAGRRDPNVAVACLARTFEREFPDRRQVASATGWTNDDIAQVDDYRGRPEIYSFPTADALLAVVPGDFTARLVPSLGYELAERCPLLVLDR